MSDTDRELAEAASRASELMNDTADAIGALQSLGYSKASDGHWRTASRAGILAGGTGDIRTDRFGSDWFSGRTLEPGAFIKAVMLARSPDASEQAIGKASLAGLSQYEESWGKATLGTTDATGGWILPNALVDDITKAPTYADPYRALLTVIPGVNAATVDVPFRAGRPTRATVVAWGQTKENLDLAYNGYSATMYTLARIYDVANQFVRKSAGAAEADVLSELRTALNLGEAYYVRQGSGTSEPFGIVTALLAGPATFRSSHTPSATTLAGSVLKAITTCIGALAARGVNSGISAVISGTAWGTMIGQGTDTAGFFINGAGNISIPGIAPGTIVTPWGTPVYVDDQATDDYLVVGQFRAAKLYLGENVRIDSSSEAGTRWDLNLTGFRGESEIGFDGRPAVYAGYFQLVSDLLP